MQLNSQQTTTNMKSSLQSSDRGLKRLQVSFLKSAKSKTSAQNL